MQGNSLADEVEFLWLNRSEAENTMDENNVERWSLKENVIKKNIYNLESEDT